MSPEKPPDLEQLATVERIITALQTLEAECDARDLKKLAKHIADCTAKCQGEYVGFHRRFYKAKGGKPETNGGQH